ncbi:hypothetical protein BpHYR1_037932, partial [Brachionus plicatilis]
MSPYVKFLGIFLLINTVWCSDHVAPNENSVLVHFMDLKRKEFVQVLPTVVNAIAKAANEFCENQTSSCGNLKNFNITSRNIKFVGSDEKEKYQEETRFLISNIYIDNEGAEEELSVLPKPVALEFFKKHRNDIVKDGKVELAYIDNELVFPQRNNLDNYLIIPISCAFCVLLIVLNLVCQIKTSKASKPKNKIYKKEPETVDDDRRDNREENKFPLLNRNEESYDEPDSARYLEPMQRFPIPSTPMLTTARQLSNIKTNPHMRLTQ